MKKSYVLIAVSACTLLGFVGLASVPWMLCHATPSNSSVPECQIQTQNLPFLYASGAVFFGGLIALGALGVRWTWIATHINSRKNSRPLPNRENSRPNVCELTNPRKSAKLFHMGRGTNKPSESFTEKLGTGA